MSNEAFQAHLASEIEAFNAALLDGTISNKRAIIERTGLWIDQLRKNAGVVAAIYRAEAKHSDRPYGPPWIGRVAKAPVEGAKDYIEYGRREDQTEQHAMIWVKPGTLVAYGRRRERQGREWKKTAQKYSFTHFAVVQEDGTLLHIERDRAVVYWHAQQRQAGN